MNGYLDKLPVSKVGAFEKGLLASMNSSHKDVLESIRKEQAISDAIKAKLVAAIDSFAKGFA